MKLELGTYVDCSDLADEQRQKLLDKFVELVGGTCYHVDENTSDFSHIEHFLVYSTNYQDERVIWFWDDHLRANIEKSYYDFFPEELETLDTVPEAPVKRVKTIDLERKTKEELVGSIDLSCFTTLEALAEHIYDVRTDNGMESLRIEAVGQHINFYETVFAESEEDYQARIKREKDLNDMYNADIQNLTKKILHLQQDLDDVSAILNGQTTLGASQVMDIKKIIGGK